MYDKKMKTQFSKIYEFFNTQYNNNPLQNYCFLSNGEEMIEDQLENLQNVSMKVTPQ